MGLAVEGSLLDIRLVSGSADEFECLLDDLAVFLAATEGANGVRSRRGKRHRRAERDDRGDS